MNPLLCLPEEKDRREAENGLAQLDHIEELVVERRISELRESHVLDLQKLAIEGIYPCGGTYRDARSKVVIENSPHILPEAARVPLCARHAIVTAKSTAS